MKQFLLISTFVSAVAIAAFLNFEPGSLLAASSYATTTVTLNVTSEIALTGCSAITMSPNISLSQDTSVGTTTCTVETTNVLGYTMTAKATSTPALYSGSNSFADFGTSTTATWSVGASEYKFGFSAYGTDALSKWGSGSSCGTAGSDTFTAAGTMQYMGFDLAATNTASRATATVGGGNSTSFCVVAEQGNSVNAPSGVYQASMVVTATTN